MSPVKLISGSTVMSLIVLTQFWAAVRTSMLFVVFVSPTTLLTAVGPRTMMWDVRVRVLSSSSRNTQSPGSRSRYVMK